MFKPQTSLLGLVSLLTVLVLLNACKKQDIPVNENTVNAARIGGYLPEDPAKLAMVPKIISSTYLKQQNILLARRKNIISPTPTGDATPPTVTITSPAAGANVSGTLNLTASASDNVGVTQVSYTVNGNAVGSATVAPYTVAWNSGTVADGTITIAAWARDAAGNQSSTSIMVTKNTTVVDPTPTPTPTPTTSNFFQLATPPVGYQGGEGSCVSFAVGYGARSIEQYYRTGGSSFSYSSNVFSPEFLYDQTKVAADCGSGSNIMQALDFVQANGICTWANMPYSYTDGCATVPTSYQWSDAANYKISGYSVLYKSDVAGIKYELSNHHPVIFGVQLDNAFINAQPGFIWRSYSSTPSAGHAMIIVGYDDSKNAWRVMNSWGTTWCESGFGWIDYNFLPNAGDAWAFAIN
ncbi:MAG: Ig-like domain-containing protein [Candidatus Dadabacteria bacterium]